MIVVLSKFNVPIEITEIKYSLSNTIYASSLLSNYANTLEASH